MASSHSQSTDICEIKNVVSLPISIGTRSGESVVMVEAKTRTPITMTTEFLQPKRIFKRKWKYIFTKEVHLLVSDYIYWIHFTFFAIEQNLAKKPKIEITITIDDFGKMKVTATDLKVNVPTSIEIQQKASMLVTAMELKSEAEQLFQRIRNSNVLKPTTSLYSSLTIEHSYSSGEEN